MKKIIVLVIVCLTSVSAIWASNPAEYAAFQKLNNKAAFNSLVGYVDADREQVRFLEHVVQVTAQELQAAEKSGQEMAIENVVNYNLRNTKFILSEEQYKKYLVFLNVYLRDEASYASLEK